MHELKINKKNQMNLTIKLNTYFREPGREGEHIVPGIRATEYRQFEHTEFNCHGSFVALHSVSSVNQP